MSATAASSRAPSPPGLLRSPVAVTGALALAVAVSYLRVAGHSFISLDDADYVYANARVLRGLTWDNLAWALGTVHLANWHPLTWLSYMLDVSLFGPNAGAMHLVNVALHAANAALLHVALERMTGARWRSALVAALFALHPTRVESVAWIAERKDVLSTLFGFLALLAYERYARRSSVKAYSLLALAYGASLASKAMLVTLPFLLVLLDVWPLGRVRSPLSPPPLPGRPEVVSWRRAVLEKLPLLAMAAAASVAAAMAQSRAGAVSTLAAGQRIANGVVSYARYLGMLAWPLDLGVLYPHPFEGWPAWQVGAAGALLVAITAAAALSGRRAPWLVVGWLWFVGMLVPAIGIVQLGAQAMADRYLYFPAIGAFVALAWSLPDPSGRARRAAPVLAVVPLATLGLATWRQVGFWSDEERLLRHTIAVTGPNARAHALLAIALRGRGRIAEAYDHILAANRIWPGNPPELTNLGIIAREAGHPEVAERSLRAAVEAGPGHVRGWYALADHLRRTGRHGEAADALRRVVALDSGNGTYWAELGVELHLTGRLDDAARAFDAAVRHAPVDPEVLRNAGVFNAHTGRWAMAADCFARADRQRPGDPDVLRRLGLAQAEAGDGTGALATAARLAPLDARGAEAIRARLAAAP